LNGRLAMESAMEGVIDSAMESAANDGYLLEVRNLNVDLQTSTGMLHAVHGIDFSLRYGEMLCLVGESGCGKSITSLALMDLLPRNAARRADVLRFKDIELSNLSEREMRAVRGKQMAMIFQEPMTSLNPSWTLGEQLCETLRAHSDASFGRARDRAVWLLEKVGIPQAASRLNQYPHQLSGGLRQRVMIAMALMCGPDLIIADEPTTALDVTIQAQILHLIRDLQREFRTAVIFITHDLGVVARIADRVAVMYAGEIVETAPVRDLFERPEHPYTQGLLECIPVPGKTAPGQMLRAIPGVVPSLIGGIRGCTFRNRCTRAGPDCEKSPPLVGAKHGVRCFRVGFHSDASMFEVAEGAIRIEPQPLSTARELSVSDDCALELCSLTKVYPLGRGLFRRPAEIRAVNNVSLRVKRGASLGLVGESGCGKTTLARMLLGLIQPTTGNILVEGREIDTADHKALTSRMQPIFQDPYSSLNPRRTVFDLVEVALRLHKVGTPESRKREVGEMLDRVGMPARLHSQYPGQLSGGQRQRVAIARALILRPKILICDEPTSALDVSVQAQILNLLLTLKKDLGITYLFISHNLSVVEHLVDSVAVMRGGVIVEEGGCEQIFHSPRHPYTRALLAAILTPEPGLGVPAIELQ
jgi:peptide/nickel transport system ATP-binding protein